MTFFFVILNLIQDPQTCDVLKDRILKLIQNDNFFLFA